MKNKKAREEDLQPAYLNPELKNITELLNIIPHIAVIVDKDTHKVLASNPPAMEAGISTGATCHEAWQADRESCPFCLAADNEKTKSLKNIPISINNKKYTCSCIQLSESSYAHIMEEQTLNEPGTEKSGKVSQLTAGESQIIKERDLARKYLDIVSLIIVALDPAGNVTMINRKGCEIVGREEKDIIGRNWANDFMTQDTKQTVFDMLGSPRQKEQAIEYTENSIITATGDQRLIAWHNIEINDNNGSIIGYLNSGMDITEQRKLEERFREAQKTEALSRLAGGVAHDFNNTLMPIVGLTDFALTNPDVLDNHDEIIHILETIKTAGNDASQIVRRLRQVYREDDGEDFVAVDLAKIVETVISLTMPRWKEEMRALGINIEMQTDFQADHLIMGNPGEIREALINLLLNAVDATESNGEITFKTHCSNDEWVILQVTDTGAGMPEEVRQRCLEPFYSTKGKKGSGLGLAMVKGIMERHNGTLEIRSVVEKGTTVELRFPAAKGEMDFIYTSTKQDPVIEPIKILIIDDEERTRNTVSRFLKVDKHDITLAENAPDGLELFFKDKFDLVITDRAMPEISGDFLAKKIHEASPETPIIMLTGFGDLMKDNNEQPEGVTRIMTKPVTQSDLRTVLSIMFKS